VDFDWICNFRANLVYWSARAMTQIIRRRLCHEHTLKSEASSPSDKEVKTPRAARAFRQAHRCVAGL